MHTKTRRALNTIGVVVVTALALTMVIMSGSASATSDQADGSALADVFSGTLGLVSPAVSLTRYQESSFGSFLTFNDPQELTIDQSTGDVYVVSARAGTVSRFTAAGLPDDFTAGPAAGTNVLEEFSFSSPSAAQVAVAPAGAVGGTAGDFYVASLAGIDIYASNGTHLGQLTEAEGAPLPEEACGVATDSTGRVYVATFGTIDRFVPSANPASNSDYDNQITGASKPCAIAADSTGAVYASTWSTGPVRKYSASDFGTSNPGTVIDTASHAVAIDPSNDDVYVDEGSKISVFDPSGTALYNFGSEEDFGTKSAGIAVAAAGGDAYVADPVNHRVDVYGPATVPSPIATTGETSEIRHVKAVLNGHLDLNGGLEITNCHFDWGTSNAYGNTIPCEQGNDYAEPADVSATLTSLEPGKSYHFRLVVSAGAKTGTGSDQTFETLVLRSTRNLLATIGPDGTSAATFPKLRAIAFRPATSSLFALDASGGIYGFDASAPPAYPPLAGFAPLAGSAVGESGSLGLAVDPTGLSSAGNLYIVSEGQGEIYGFGPAGTPLSSGFPIEPRSNPGPPAGSPPYICAAAVDSTGQLWVSNYNTQQILRYSSTGVFLGSLDVSAQGLIPCFLAFDSNDDLYVSDQQGGFDNQSTWRYTAASGYTNATQIDSNGGAGVAVDQANHHILIANSHQVRELDSSGHLLGTFAEGVPGATNRGVAVDPASGDVFVGDVGNGTVRVYGPPVYPPEVSVQPARSIANTTTTIEGSLNPQGYALSDCRFEYTTDAEFQANGFAGAATAPCSPSAASIPVDLEYHTIAADLSGLDRNTVYHYRLRATSSQGTSASSEATFTTAGPVGVETVGSPMRTATTAQLEGRLDPHLAPSTYHFEYGDQGPCDSNPCASTPAQTAGDGDTIEFVSQTIAGLKAGTTYHYRLVGDNGNVDGAALGSDFTVTTRASDTPLTHGHFPGPPGSDRAWEQVNVPDTDGNPVTGALTVSDSGERVVYNVDGAIPGSQTGGGLSGDNDQFAERTADGWRTKSLYPTRAQSSGNVWEEPKARSDLSEVYAVKADSTNAEPVEIWRLKPGLPAQLVLSLSPSEYPGRFTQVSTDGSRIVSVLRGEFDPEHPVGPGVEELYDITTGTPRMVGLLPDGSVPPCGVTDENQVTGGASYYGQHWVSPDGSHVFFMANPGADCGSRLALYVRDLGDSSTVQLAPEAKFIRSTSDAAFFMTEASLVPADHGGNDVYRYTIADSKIDCLTCSTVAAGSVYANYSDSNAGFDSVAVPDDGSRLYFRSTRRLVEGAADEGVYRLDVLSRDLAYVAPADGVYNIGGNVNGGNAITPDGSMFVFVSNGSAINTINGQQNGGTDQYYLYDDNDRSLTCVSCPPDGSSPRGAVSPSLRAGSEGTPNESALTNSDFVFVTPTPLVRTDQNTALPGRESSTGDDVYEWREGQLLLVTDGQRFNRVAPKFEGMSPDGRDVFFTQAAQLTPDAIDSQARLYDARIGGGFDFPPPPPPCSLEACQGNPLAPPDDATPSSLTFSGPGNQANNHKSQVVNKASSKRCGTGKCTKSQSQKRCAKGRVLKRGKCVKKRLRGRARRANHNHGGAK